MKQTLKLILLLFLNQVIFAQTDTIDWVSDLEYIKTELPRKHYDLFFQLSENEFNKQFDRLIDNAPNLTNYEVLDNLSRIIAQIGDSHTNINYGYFKKADRILPFSFYWFRDGIFITHARVSSERLLGHELISINGFPIQQIVDSLKTLIVIDNNSTIKNMIPRMIGFVPHLEFFGFSKSDSILIITREISGRHIETILVKQQIEKEKVIKYEPDSMSFCWSNQDKFFTQTYFEKDNIMYVQYNRCWSKEVEYFLGSWKRAKSLPSFYEFRKEVFNLIKNNDDIEKIIFDLRFNGGGASHLGASLVKKIAKNNSLNQRGKLFVITGKQTYSSGVINTLYFKDKTNAIFIGELTSGKPNGYGEVKYLILPKSGLKINYSTKYFNRYKPDSDAFYPDIEIETSFQDYKNGIDPVYEYIRDL